VNALAALIDAEIAAGRKNGGDKLLRDFVREFRGLSGTAKAKQVCAALPPHVRRLADLNGDTPLLLATMRETTTPAKPAVLGEIGADHIRTCFDRWYGIVRDRFWYHRVTVMDGAIPLVVEAAVAETTHPGNLKTAVNFSPTFDDPLAGRFLDVDKASGYGVSGLLRACHCSDGPTFSAFVHIVHPALTFLDRGKSRVDPSPALVNAARTAVWKAAKTAWAEGEQRRKDSAAASRQRQAQERAWERSSPKITLKDAAFAVMEQAWAQATDNGSGPAGARTIYYQARPLMQEFTDDVITDTYFTQALLPAYQREVRELPGVYYEPRGTLNEPHTGKSVPLGTREVDGYQVPKWTYDKILFVEKQGLWPMLEASGLAERYDMAIIAGAGFATVAARTLLDRAESDCTIFVLHDADPNGYLIDATVREATPRMPNHRIDVIDIGLTLDEAATLDLVTESFSRKSALPARLTLGDTERLMWKADQAATKQRPVECVRVELNAMTYPQLIAHIEAALEQHGATTKVVPPESVITMEASARIRDDVGARLREKLDAIFDLNALADRIAAGMAGGAERLTSQAIRDQIEPNQTVDWRTAVSDWAGRTVTAADDVIDQALREAIVEYEVNEEAAS